MANYKKSFNFRNGVQVDNDNFIVNANGLVGIGTSIPTEFLDVRGTAKVSGIVSTSDLFVTEDVFVSGASTVTILDATSLNATGVVTAQQFIGDGSLLSGVVAIARTGWVINSSGISTLTHVGIGTTNPATLLQIGDDPTSATYGVGIDSTGQSNFTGIITAQSGVHIDDSIVHIGDTNTKIRFPAADTFTVETSGDEKLRVSSTGKLQVYRGTSTTGKTSGSEAFTVGNGAGNHRFAVYPDGTTVIGGTGDIANNNIILQNDGKIGIGTTNPEDYYSQSNELVVGGNATASSPNRGISIVSAPTGTGSIVFADGAGDSENRRGQIVYDHSTDSLELFTDETEKFRVSSAGNVGIATSTPTSKLHVVGDAKVSGVITATNFIGDLSGNVNSGISTFTVLKVGTAVTMSAGIITATSFVGSVTGNVTGDLTGDVTGNVTGYLSGVAQTAGFASTSFGLEGTPAITVGNIVGSSATVTALVVDNKLGIGSDTPAADMEIRKTTNTAIDVITSLNTARISVGQSVGTGNSSGVLSFNSGTLSLSNYDLGGVNVNLHSGSGSGTTESFKVRYDDNTKFETTYDGKVGVNRHGITLTRELEVGGNVFVSGYGQFSGIVTVGQGSNQLTLGDGSALPISSSAVINITSGITTFNDVLVNRNFRVGTGIATLSGDTFIGGKLGVGTASDAGFLGAYSSTIFGDFYSTGAIVGRTELGITTTADGSLQVDPRTIPSGLGQVVPEVAYGNFQADGGSFTMFGGTGLFVPTVGVATIGYGATNLGMTQSDHDSTKYLTRIGINTYFARSVLDVGMASTTMSSFVIMPSLNNEELDIVANLHTSNAGGNQNVNPVQSGFGTATAKKLLGDSGVPGGSVVYNNESRRLNVSTGGTVFCGIATLTQNQSGYDSLAIPTFNTTKRNLMSGYGNLPKGAIMYNTTTNKLNFWNGSAWEAVTSST